MFSFKNSFLTLITVLLGLCRWGEFIHGNEDLSIDTVIKRIGLPNSKSDLTALANPWDSDDISVISGIAKISSSTDTKNLIRFIIINEDCKYAADHSNTLSAFGKTLKIGQLLQKLKENIFFIEKETLISLVKTNGILDKDGMTDPLNIFNFINSIIDNTDDSKIGSLSDAPENDYAKCTLNSFLNTILQKIRDTDIYTKVPDSDSPKKFKTFKNYCESLNALEKEPADTLYAITQTGIQGISPKIISQIAQIDGETITPKTILQSKDCWETIFGKKEDPADPIGSLYAQLESVDNNEDILKKFEEIINKAKNLSSIPLEVYEYLMPKLTDVIALDRLNLRNNKLEDKNNPNDIETLAKKDKLTIQECLTCLLSGVTDNLVFYTKIEECCNAILKLLPKDYSKQNTLHKDILADLNSIQSNLSLAFSQDQNTLISAIDSWQDGKNELANLITSITNTLKQYPLFTPKENNDDESKKYNNLYEIPEENFSNFKEELAKVSPKIKKLFNLTIASQENENLLPEETQDPPPAEELKKTKISTISTTKTAPLTSEEEANNLWSAIQTTIDKIINTINKGQEKLSGIFPILSVDSSLQSLCEEIQKLDSNFSGEKILNNLDLPQLKALQHSISNFQELFKDPGCCTTTAQYAMKIYEKLKDPCLGLSSSDIEHINNYLPTFNNNKSFNNLLLEIFTIINNSALENPPEIKNPYGACGQLLESLENITQLIHEIHAQTQKNFWESNSNNALEFQKNFENFLKELENNILPILTEGLETCTITKCEGKCATCNLKTWKKGNILQKLRDLIFSLKKLRPDLQANKTSQELISPLTSLIFLKNFLSEISKEPLLSPQQLSQLTQKIQKHYSSPSENITDELKFLCETLFQDFHFKNSPEKPSFSSFNTINSSFFVEEIASFIKDSTQSIISYLNIIAQKSEMHYHNELFQALSILISNLPTLEKSIISYAEDILRCGFIKASHSLRFCAQQITFISKELRNLKKHLLSEKYLTLLNTQLYYLQESFSYVLESINNGNNQEIDIKNEDIKNFFQKISKILTEKASVKDLVEAISSFPKISKPSNDSPTLTPLEVTLYNTLRIFAMIPDCIHSFLEKHKNDESPKLPQKNFLKSFQEEASNFIYALQKASFPQLFSLKSYQNVLFLLNNYPLEALYKSINLALDDIEKAFYRCPLQNQIDDIYQVSLKLYKKILKNEIPPHLSERNNNFDNYLKNLEKYLSITQLKEKSSITNLSITNLESIKSILLTMNTFFSPLLLLQDNSPKILLNIQQINLKIEAIRLHMNAVILWFQNLLQHPSWKEASFHPHLSILFNTFSRVLSKLYLSTSSKKSIFPYDLYYQNFIDLEKFACDFLAIIGQIQKSSKSLSKLCTTCHHCQKLYDFKNESVIKTLIQNLEQTGILLNDIAHYISTQHSPSYDIIQKIIDILNQFPKVQSLSCLKTHEYIDTCNKNIDLLNKQLSLYSSNPRPPSSFFTLDALEGISPCQALEIGIVKVLKHLTQVIDSFKNIRYNTHAPPPGEWRPLPSFVEAISNFSSNINSLLSSINFCSVCNQRAFLNIFDKIKKQLSFLTVLSFQFYDQWNSYKIYDEIRPILINLNNLYAINSTFDSYFRSQTNTSKLLKGIKEWNYFLENFTNITKFNKNLIPKYLNYNWKNDILIEPTVVQLKSSLEDLSLLAQQNISTIRYIHEFLIQNIEYFEIQTIEIISSLQKTLSVWKNFIPQISLPIKILTLENPLFVIPQHLIQLFQTIPEILETTLQSLSQKPSCCYVRAQHLSLISQNLDLIIKNLKTSDSNDFFDIESIYNTLTILQQNLMHPIPCQAQQTSKIPIPIPQKNKTFSCTTIPLILHQITQKLSKIENIFLSLDKTYCNEQLGFLSDIPQKQENLLKILNILQSFKEMTLSFCEKCPLCNTIAFEKYREVNLHTIKSIEGYIGHIYDRFLHLSSKNKVKELQIISQFTTNLALYFNKTIRNTAWFKNDDHTKNETSQFLQIALYLQDIAPFIQTWLSTPRSDFINLQEKIEKFHLLPVNSILIENKNDDQYIYQYDKIFYECFKSIQSSLLATKTYALQQTLRIPNLDFIKALHIFSNTIKMLITSIHNTKISYDKKQPYSLINPLHDIREICHTLEKIQINCCQDWAQNIFYSSQKIEKIAKSLINIDKKLKKNTSLPSLSEQQTLEIIALVKETPDNLSILDYFCTIATKFSQLFNSTEIHLISTQAPLYFSCETIPVYATRYHTWFKQISPRLISIAHQLEPNINASVSFTVQNILLSLKNYCQTLGNLIRHSDRCAFCDNYTIHSFFSEYNKMCLSLVPSFQEAISQLVDSLKSKCCLQESKNIHQIAFETYKIKKFFQTIIPSQLLAFSDNSILVHLKNIISTLNNPDFNLTAHQSETALPPLIENLSCLNKALFLHLQKKLLITANTIDNYNCRQKSDDLLKIKCNINKINQYIKILYKGIKKKNFEYNPFLISTLQAFQNLSLSLINKLPHELSACEECRNYMHFSSMFNLLSPTLINFNKKTKNLIKILLSPPTCQENADQLLNMFFSFASCQECFTALANYFSKNKISEYTRFSDFLKDIIESLKNIDIASQSFDFKEESCKKLTSTFKTLLSTLEKTYKNYTQKTFSSPTFLIKIKPQEVLPFILYKITQGLKKISSSIGKIQILWDEKPPTYSPIIDSYLTEIFNIVINIQHNTQKSLLTSLGHFKTCLICKSPTKDIKTDLFESLKGQSISGLSTLFSQIPQRKTIEQFYSIACALHKLNHALASCSLYPVLSIKHREEEPTVNITNTTNLNSLIMVWTKTLPVLLTQIENNSEELVRTITSLAEDICTKHKDLNGKILPEPLSLIQETLSLSSLSSLIIDSTKEICGHFCHLLDWYSQQPFSVNPFIHKAIYQTLQILPKLSLHLQYVIDSNPFAEKLSTIILSLQFISDRCKRFLYQISIPQCHKKTSQSLDNFRRMFQQFSQELSFLGDILEGSQNKITQNTEYINLVQSFLNEFTLFNQNFSQFTESIVLLPPNILCHDEMTSQFLSLCTGNILNLNSSGNICQLNDKIKKLYESILGGKYSKTSELPPCLEAGNLLPCQQIQISLNQIFCILKTTLYKALETIEHYTESTFQHIYNKSHSENIKNIYKAIITMQDQVKSLIQSSHRFCSYLTDTVLLQKIEEEFKSIIHIAKNIYLNIKKRFWFPYAQTMHTFYLDIKTHTHYLKALATIQESNKALEGEKSSENYRKLEETLQSILQSFNTISHLDKVNIEEFMNEEDIQKSLELFKNFLDNLPYNKVLNSSLQNTLDILEITYENTLLTENISKNPIKQIFQDISQILQELQNQALFLQKIQHLKTGLGNKNIQKYLNDISQLVNPANPCQKILFQNFQNIFCSFYETIEKFYKNEGEKINIPEFSKDLEMYFTNISLAISSLSSLFDTERCKYLTYTYISQLSPQIKKFGIGLQQFLTTTPQKEFNLSSLLSSLSNIFIDQSSSEMGILPLIQNLSQTLKIYFLENNNNDYCTAGVVNIYIEKIAKHISNINQSLFNDFAIATSDNIPPFSNEDSCQSKLEEARRNVLQSLEEISFSLQKATSYLKTYALKDPLSKDHKTILEEISHNLLVFHKILQDLQIDIRSMCTSCAKRENSSNFIENLMIHLKNIYIDFINLTDTLKTFCCSQNLEKSWIKIVKGTSLLTQKVKTLLSLKDKEIFKNQVTTEKYIQHIQDQYLTFFKMIKALKSPLSSYLEADIHSENQNSTLKEIANILLPLSNQEASLVNFNVYSLEEYINQTINNLRQIPLIFLDFNQKLQHQTFSKNLDLIKIIQILTKNFNDLSSLFNKIPRSTPFLHRVELIARNRIQIKNIFDETQKTLLSLKETLCNSTAEKQIQRELYITTNIFAQMTSILPIFQNQIESGTQASHSIQEKINQVYSTLLTFKPQNLPSETNLPQHFQALQNTWKNIIQNTTIQTFTEFTQHLSNINSNLYLHTLNFIKIIDPEIEINSSSTTLPPDSLPFQPINLLLTKLHRIFQTFVKAVNDLSITIKNVPSSPYTIQRLIEENGPILAILLTQESVSSLAYTLFKFPHIAYNCYEYAKILDSFSPLFSSLSLTISEIKDTLKKQENSLDLKLYYNILQQLQHLSFQLSSIPSSCNLENASKLFEKLVLWSEQLPAQNSLEKYITWLNVLLKNVNDSFLLPQENLIFNNNYEIIPHTYIEIKKYIQEEILYIRDFLQILTHKWLEPPYKLNKNLIKNIFIFLHNIHKSPQDLSLLNQTLQNFIEKLSHPTCYQSQKDDLITLNDSLVSICQDLDFLMNLQNLPTLNDQDYRALCQYISSFTTNFIKIEQTLLVTTNFDCLNESFLRNLKTFSTTLMDVKDNIQKITSLLGNSLFPSPSQILPLTTVDQQIEILLTRVTNYITNIQNALFLFIKHITPEIGQSKPYRTELITQLSNALAPILTKFSQTFKNFEQLTKKTHLCALHNPVHFKISIQKTNTNFQKMIPYIPRLTKKLSQFKYSELGESVHSYEYYTYLTKILLQKLTTLKESDQKLIQIQDCLSALQQNFVENYQIWFNLVKKLSSCLKSTQKLKIFSDSFKNFVKTSESNVFSLQKILSILTEETVHLPDKVSVIYSKNQIINSIYKIKSNYKIIFDSLLRVIHDNFIRERLFNLQAASLFNAASRLYKFLNSYTEIIQAPHDFYSSILSSFLPPQNSDILCKQLAFSLSHQTCCEDYRNQLNNLMISYADVLDRLNKMVSPFLSSLSGKALPDETALNTIILNLKKITPLCQNNNSLTQNLILYLESANTLTCLSQNNFPILQTLQTLTKNLQEIIENIGNISQARNQLYSLSNENTHLSFLNFSDHILKINPYYNEEVSIQWCKINQVILQQNKNIKTLFVILKNKTLCFLNDSQNEYYNRIKTLRNFEEYTQSSVQALETYKNRCYSRNSMHLYRIYQQLISLSHLKDLLFRNNTFKDAENCLKTFKTSLQEIDAILLTIHQKSIHELSYFNSLSSLENSLRNINKSLENYSLQHNLPFKKQEIPQNISFESNDLIKYLKSISEYLQNKLPVDLEEWYSTLSQETGQNNNERCYTNSMSLIHPIILNLQKTFENWTLTPPQTKDHPFYPDQKQILLIFNKISESLKTIEKQSENMNKLLEDPTCCYQRAQAFNQIYIEINAIYPYLTSAIKAINPQNFSISSEEALNFSNNIQKTTEFLKNLKISLSNITYNPQLTCQAPIIFKQTKNIVLPYTQKISESLRKTFKTLGPILQPLHIIDIDLSHSCQAISIISTTLSSVFEKINTVLTALNTQLLQTDLFDYHENLIKNLKSFLLALYTTHNRLFTFCNSFNSSSCRQCTDHIDHQPIEKFLSCIHTFEQTLRILETNHDKHYAKIFHNLVRTLDIFRQRFSLLFSTDLNPIASENMEKLKSCFQFTTYSLSSIIPLLQNHTKISSHDPLSYSSYIPITQLIDQITQHIESILQGLNINFSKIEFLEPNYSSYLIKDDFNNLISIFKQFTTLFSVQNMQIQKQHSVFLSIWKELNYNLYQIALTLQETTWLAPITCTNIATDQLPLEAFHLYESQKYFLEKLQKIKPSQSLNPKLQEFIFILKTLYHAFDISMQDFSENLSLEKQQTFIQNLQNLSEQMDSITRQITSTNINPENKPSFICIFNEEELQKIIDKFLSIKDITLKILTLFTPNLFEKLSLLPQNNKIEAERPVIYRQIVIHLSFLQKAMKAAWDQAKLCPVRDYRQSSIDHLQKFITNFNIFAQNVPLTFNFITPCLYHNEIESQLILKEIPIILSQTSEDFSFILSYLKETCCSQLTYKIYQLADKLDIIYQYLKEKKEAKTETLEKFIKNFQTSDLNDFIQKNHLTEWSQFFLDFQENTCISSKITPFIDQWLSILEKLLTKFQNNDTLHSFTSSLEHPKIYNCTEIPKALKKCFSFVPFYNEALQVIEEKLQNSQFLYSEIFSFYTTLVHFNNALTEISKTCSLLSSEEKNLCTNCVNISEITQKINKTSISVLQEHIHNLRSILDKYCDFEVTVSLHSYNYHLTLLAIIFQDIASNINSFWEDKLNTLGDTTFSQIATFYTKKEGINESLKKILQVPPKDTVCQMIQIIPYSSLAQNNFSKLVKTFSSKAISNSNWYEQQVNEYTLPTVDTTSFQKECAESLKKLLKLEETLNSLYKKVQEEKLFSNIKISSNIFIIATEGIEAKAEILLNIYQYWKENSPCPKWKDCTICETCQECQNCPCKTTTYPIRYNIWHIAQKLQNIAKAMKNFSNSIINNCCTESYAYLFEIPKHISNLNLYCLNIFQSENVFDNNLLQDFIEVLNSKLSKLPKLGNLVQIREESYNKPKVNCRMIDLKDGFKKLLEIFIGSNPDENSSQQGVDKGLNFELSEFFKKHNLVHPSLQKMEELKNTCQEIESILQFFSEYIDRIVKTFKNLTQKLKDFKTINKTIAEPLQKLYQIFYDTKEEVKKLSIKDNKESLCNNCTKDIINPEIKKIEISLDSLAQVILDLKNTFMSPYCCTDFGNSLSQTNYLIQVFVENIGLLSESLPISSEIQPEFYVQDFKNIIQSLNLANSAMMKILSEHFHLKKVNSVTFCHNELLIPGINNFNDKIEKEVIASLQAFLGKIGVSPKKIEQKSFALQTCQSIPSIFESLSSSLKVLYPSIMLIFDRLSCLKLTDFHFIYLSQIFKNLTSTLFQTSQYLYELYMENSHNKTCCNCNSFSPLKDIYLTVFKITEATSNIHAYFSKQQFFDIATFLEKLLKNYGSFSQTLKGLYLMDAANLQLDIFNKESPCFYKIINIWNQSFSAISRTLPTLQNQILFYDFKIDRFARSLFLKNLEEISKNIQEIDQATQIFIIEILNSFPEKIQLLQSQRKEYEFVHLKYDNDHLIPSAFSILASYSFNAAEAVQWFSENCAYLNITASDSNTFSSLEEFFSQIQNFSNQIQKLCKILSTQSLKDFYQPYDFSCVMSSLQAFADSSYQLKETLRPKISYHNFVRIINDWSELLQQAALLLNKTSPIMNPLCNLQNYTNDLEEFFNIFSHFAPWVAQIHETLYQNIFSTLHFIEQLEKSPIYEIHQKIFQICQLFNPSIKQIIVDKILGTPSQSLRNLSLSFTALGEEIYHFMEKIRNFHISQKIEIHTNALINLPIAVLSTKNEFSNLKKMLFNLYSTENPSLSLGLQSIEDSLEIFYKITFSMGSIFDDLQENTQIENIRTFLNSLTLTNQEIPVLEELFKLSFDDHGSPQISQEYAISDKNSLLNQTGRTLNKAQILHHKIFSQAFSLPSKT